MYFWGVKGKLQLIRVFLWYHATLYKKNPPILKIVSDFFQSLRTIKGRTGSSRDFQTVFNLLLIYSFFSCLKNIAGCRKNGQKLFFGIFITQIYQNLGKKHFLAGFPPE